MLKPLSRKTANIFTNHPVKVLQFGEGNFLRGFVDWMIDIMNEKINFNGAVQIIQPLPNGLGDVLNKQEGLYHVVLNGIKNSENINETRLISAVKEVINPYNDFEKYLKTAENPDLEIIFSNTTEAGIAIDATDHDYKTLAKSFPGKLTQLLYHRFKKFNGDTSKSLCIIPCELIDKNGETLKNVILNYSTLWNLPAEFKDWISIHTLFCNTLVDRIIPGFPKETIQQIKENTGFDDNLVVMGEPFHLFVIEGPELAEQKFPASKAGLDVLFVKDQSPYRTRKVRILNGAHTAMVPVAYLHGLRTVREAIENPYINEFVRKVIFQEIIPTLDLPKEELEKFADDVVDRFKNPYIKHELISISLNSISKFQVRVLPSLLKYVKLKNSLPENLVYSLAALILFYKGDYADEKIPLNDTADVLEFMKEAWENDNFDTTAQKILSNIFFWNQDLCEIPGLLDAVIKNMFAIQTAMPVMKIESK